MRLILFLITINLLSCARITQNTIQEGEFYFGEGRLGNILWEDSFRLKRVTFFSGFNMAYDILVGRFPEGTGYENWLNYREKKSLKNCPQFFILGYFSGEGKDSVIRSVVSQVVGRSGKELGFNHFFENLSAHPDFIRNNFDLYTFRGICFESPKDSIVISPTGFGMVDILPKK